MSEPSHSSGLTSADSKTAAKRNAYRKASAALGIINGALSLIALQYHQYFLYTRVLSVTAVVMILGSLLVAIRHTTSGALLVLLGASFGGFLGLPFLLWALLAGFGGWVSRLPLAPLGFVLPIASFVLALMSREPSEVKFLH